MREALIKANGKENPVHRGKRRVFPSIISQTVSAIIGVIEKWIPFPSYFLANLDCEANTD